LKFGVQIDYYEYLFKACKIKRPNGRGL